jgi:hypothetical protein
MKIMLLALLFPIFCQAQSEKATNSNAVFQDSIPQTSFYLKDRRVVFSNLTKRELADKIYSILNTTKNFRLNFEGMTNADFYGKLIQYQFDRARYNATFFNSSLALTVPINADVTVQVKDYKYRVTISEITFKYFSPKPEENVNFTLDGMLIDRNGKKIMQSKSNTKLANFLSTDFASLFDVNRSMIANDF